ncbi:MAG: OmpH family outer membrane protein [Phycisphaerae bacterium]
MNHHQLTAAVLALSLSAGLLLSAQEPTTRPVPPSGVQVGIVNIEDVFNHSQQASDTSKRLMAKKKKLEEENRSRENKIKDMQAKLSTLEAGSDEHSDLRKTIRDGIIALQAWQKSSMVDLQQQWGDTTVVIYKNIRKAIEETAEDRGLKLVLPDTSRIKADTPEELVEKVRQPRVLYFHESLDITREVIERLNNTYRDKLQADKKRDAEKKDGNGNSF